MFYVLPYRSLSDLIVADRECRKGGLPRPCGAPTDLPGEKESYALRAGKQACGSATGSPRPGHPLLRAISARRTAL